MKECGGIEVPGLLSPVVNVGNVSSVFLTRTQIGSCTSPTLAVFLFIIKSVSCANILSLEFPLDYVHVKSIRESRDVTWDKGCIGLLGSKSYTFPDH